MIAYNTKTVTGKKRLLYIVIDLEDAKKIYAGIKDYSGSKQIHLTTDRYFDEYVAKRLEVPLFVHICQTRRELESRLELLGVYI